jgi:hydrogenase expression/formation protein HypE
MRQLIEKTILPELDNDFLRAGNDAASLPACAGALAMTTDSFVVSPLFFPGGDIGSLAVYGTVNDLAVTGAAPRWISLALILEEGLELSALVKVLRSVAVAARRCNIQVVTGDTKVVPRGAADRLFINTTGLGEFVVTPPLGASALQVGDELIVTGPIGQHGIAVMVAREGLDFEPPPQSDSGPLANAVGALQQAGVPVRSLRDATRGGLGAVFFEWSEASGTTIAIEEQLLPISAEVRGACELLGLDPIHVANEGTMLVAVPPGQASRAIDVLKTVPETSQSAYIGRIERRGLAAVVIERGARQRLPLDEPVGAPLPRIC